MSGLLCVVVLGALAGRTRVIEQRPGLGIAIGCQCGARQQYIPAVVSGEYSTEPLFIVATVILLAASAALVVQNDGFYSERRLDTNVFDGVLVPDEVNTSLSIRTVDRLDFNAVRTVFERRESDISMVVPPEVLLLISDR
jgi:hypothetical protein